jgi:hypothetical protein
MLNAEVKVEVGMVKEMLKGARGKTKKKEAEGWNPAFSLSTAYFYPLPLLQPSCLQPLLQHPAFSIQHCQVQNRTLIPS